MDASDSRYRAALRVLIRLREAGHEALLAGGCVRDSLLGIPPKDYDVATSATPDQVIELFGHRKTIAIGAAFGVVAVLGSRAAGHIEVATFRSDGDYSDGRHPNEVRFTTAEADAQRRDFTINGLFYDPIGAQVLDYVGGVEDLQARRLRAIGDPDARFREDRLRLLRAVRFAARFDFEIESATLAAIHTAPDSIAGVSGERIGNELRAMLIDRNRAVALRRLREANLESPVFGRRLDSDLLDWDQRKAWLESLNDCEFTTALAASIYGVEDGLLTQLAERWKLTNKEVESTAWLQLHLPMVRGANTAPWPRLQPVLAHPLADQLVQLAAGIDGDASPHVCFCRERRKWPQDMLDPARLVTGGDLIAAGVAPGPELGRLLARIRDLQLLGELTSRGEAVDWAVEQTEANG